MSKDNNRSLLALAGQHTLGGSHSAVLPTKQNQPYPQPYMAIQAHPLKISRPAFDTKTLIKRLGLNRLRKMQALVRGFLIRRLVYPKALKEYLIASSVFDILSANVIYREVIGIIV